MGEAAGDYTPRAPRQRVLAAHRLARGGALTLGAPHGRLLRAKGGGLAAARQRRADGRVHAACGGAKAHRRLVRWRRADRGLLGGPLVARVVERRDKKERVARACSAREDAVLGPLGRADALLADAEAFGRSGCLAGADRELGARDGVAADEELCATLVRGRASGRAIGRGGLCHPLRKGWRRQQARRARARDEHGLGGVGGGAERRGQPKRRGAERASE
eukprot:scaffold62599_cov66-Phaeocystis_antarctica.AAC.4